MSGRFTHAWSDPCSLTTTNGVKVGPASSGCQNTLPALVVLVEGFIVIEECLLYENKKVWLYRACTPVWLCARASIKFWQAGRECFSVFSEEIKPWAKNKIRRTRSAPLGHGGEARGQTKLCRDTFFSQQRKTCFFPFSKNYSFLKNITQKSSNTPLVHFFLQPLLMNFLWTCCWFGDSSANLQHM